jgi:hypothetical protein
LPGRLMAGQRFLVPFVGVRVLPGQQKDVQQTSFFFEDPPK